MSRAVALLLIAATLAWSGSGYAAPREAGAMAESCPMMMHRTSPEPCLAAPCPCDHGKDGQLLPAGPLFAPTVDVASGPDSSRHGYGAAPAHPILNGYPHALDRPPTRFF